jgi:deoxyribodipyrimidine photo-lyase
VLEAPRKLELPPGIRTGRLPSADSLVAGKSSPGLIAGGEGAARKRLERWLRGDLAGYEDGHDDLAGARTSRLSTDLHFGSLSANAVLERAEGRPGGGAFVRQLCWRDFHHQVLAATPSLPRRDYRPRRDRWSRSKRALEAWREGRTGYPLVDAAMRQLAEEGFMHNRARMTVASFLCKDLYVDWREGAWHFWDLLSDGEIANNAGNWQWVAGTGNDTRPNRVLNPVRQAQRFDPDGEYVRRYLPELESLGRREILRPWTAKGFGQLDYPEPIVDHDEAAAAFKAHRGA